MTAVAASVIQKACHTPSAFQNLLKINAIGIISKPYRSEEITRDGLPIPNPSSAPQEMTETEETTKPALMMRRALLPMAMVSVLEENRPINSLGISQQSAVPTDMMQMDSASAVRYIFPTRLYSPAPKLYPMTGRIP